MKKNIRKLLAALLAMIMMITCAAASAQIVEVDLDVDSEGVKNILTMTGMPEDQLSTADPIIALLNALCVKVTSVKDGAQIDLALNDENALTLGFASDEKGTQIVSSLFPNYLLSASSEAIQGLLQGLMASMPAMGMGGAAGAEGGAAGFDMEAMMAPMMSIATYFQKYSDTIGKTAVPGEPVSGEYEFEGMKFNTYVPITIDIPAAKKATEELVNEIMADESVMGLLQGFATSGGSGEFKPEDMKKSLDDFIEHFPENVTADFYNNADAENDPAFYMEGRAIYEGQTEPSLSYTMLQKDQQTGKMTFKMAEPAMDMAMEFEENHFYAEVDVSGLKVGVDVKTGDTTVVAVYYMNMEKPLLTVTVAVDPNGERTLPVEAGEKTVVTLEELMGGTEASQGLVTDITSNGLGQLIQTLTKAVPEAGNLIMMMMPMNNTTTTTTTK